MAPRNTTAERVDQSLLIVPQQAKKDALIHLIREKQWFQVLVFSRTKHGADRLAKQLAAAGIPSEALHGNKAQNARTRTLESFKRGRLQVLVATDIAARGIDVDQLPMVVNFELPHVPEDYVHRIGRTGRAGSSGGAVSLVDPVAEEKQLRAIEKVIKRRIERVEIAGFTVAERPAGAASQRTPRGAKSPSQRHSHRHQGDRPRSDAPRPAVSNAGESKRSPAGRSNAPRRARSSPGVPRTRD